MSLSDVFMNRVPLAPAAGAGLAKAATAGQATEVKVSAFLTVASFTNFSAMSMAIAAAWQTLQQLAPGVAWLKGPGLPLLLALAWCLVSLYLTWEEAKKAGTFTAGAMAQALFMGLVNAVVLAGAVTGMVKAVA